MVARRVVYSCLFGGYETLLDQPVAAATTIPFVLFTDDPQLTSDTWQVRHVPAAFPADQNRSSRRPKILAHEYLPDHDESLYVDNTVLLTVSPERLFDELLPPDVGFAAAAHSYRDTVRDEFGAVVAAGKDVDIVCAEQLAHYEQVAPAVLEQRPLWGGLMLRRHHDPAVRATMQTWWEHVLRYSRRDQLSLPLALAQSGLPHRVLDLDNLGSDFHQWPRADAGRDPAGGAPADLAAGLRADAALARQAAEAAERDAATARAAAAAAQADAAAARAEAGQARAEAADLRGALDTARTSARAAEHTAQERVREQQQRADAALSRVRTLETSRSWRATAPLRTASRSVASAVRRANAARRSGGPDPR